MLMTSTFVAEAGACGLGDFFCHCSFPPFYECTKSGNFTGRGQAGQHFFLPGELPEYDHGKSLTAEHTEKTQSGQRSLFANKPLR